MLAGKRILLVISGGRQQKQVGGREQVAVHRAPEARHPADSRAVRSNRGRSSNNRDSAARNRERSPRDLTPFERPAVATIRHIIDREEAFHRRDGRYATFADLGRAGAFLDVPSQTLNFRRRGYRFELALESNGFRIVAEPMAPGPRSFVGDDSGFIRAGVD